MHKPVRNIAKDAQGNISFDYMTTATVPTAIVSARQEQSCGATETYGLGGERLGKSDSLHGSLGTPTIVVTRQGDRVVKKLTR